jgi:hypothetical protein
MKSQPQLYVYVCVCVCVSVCTHIGQVWKYADHNEGSKFLEGKRKKVEDGNRKLFLLSLYTSG